jgi:hypothetical protein
MQLLIAHALAAEDQGPGSDVGRPGCPLSRRVNKFPVRWISSDPSFEASPCPEGAAAGGVSKGRGTSG